MDQDHSDSIKQYVNDVIGMERDITNAIQGQLDDDRLATHPDLKMLLAEVAAQSESRLQRFKDLSDAEDASFGATVKEGVMAVTGTLAGLYGKLREHPLSRMLRDDIVATTVAATSYTMLLTLGLAANHSAVIALAEEGLKASARFTMQLGQHLPLIVASELAKDAPLSNPGAAQLAADKMQEAWAQG